MRFRVNETTENIGARRLHTILERVLDEISFQAPDLFKSPRAEMTEEGVVGEVHASAPLTGEPQMPSPPLPVIERQTANGRGEGDRGGSGVCAAAGGFDCEGSGSFAVYFVDFFGVAKWRFCRGFCDFWCAEHGEMRGKSW